MDMTDEEIIYRYRHGAEPPKNMVKILAELNAVKESAIVQLLYEHGELSGQAIYQYRKSGKLDCTDEEAAEFAKIKEDEKAGKDETAGDPSQSAAPTASNREPSPCLWKAPAIVLDKLKEWLNSNFTEYQVAKMEVQEYDEIFDFWKLIGGEDE